MLDFSNHANGNNLCALSLGRFKKGGRGWKNPFKNRGTTGHVRNELKNEDQVRVPSSN